MNALHQPRRGALKLDTLAACLALALSTGVNAASIAQPRSNVALDVTAGPSSFGSHNRPFANRPRAEVAKPPSPNATQVVSHCSDDDTPGSLRAAIASAGTGDTIDMSGLTCSAITLNPALGYIPIDVDGLSLLGRTGSNQLVIDGNGTQIFASMPYENLSISNLTLTNGSSPYGGCVYAGGNLTLTNSTITGCHANTPAPATEDSYGSRTYGGGLDVKGDLTMTASTVTGNEANGSRSAAGGGVYVRGSTTISDSLITNNYARAAATSDFRHAFGGGLLAIGIGSTSAGLSISNSTIANNSVKSLHGVAYGGGIHFLSTGGAYDRTGTIDHSIITGNTAYSVESWSYGGGIAAGASSLGLFRYERPASIDISYSTISGNSATSGCTHCVLAGGGVMAFGKIDLTNSTVNANRAVADASSSATAYGGGLATRFARSGDTDGVITVHESTISGNMAAGRAGSQGGYGRGGGVAALLSPFTIENSTLAFNVASTSGGGAIVGTNVATHSTLNSSIVANNEATQARDIGLAAPFTNNTTVTIDGASNLVIAASANLTLPGDTLHDDPQLLPLADNGGPTQTHALRPSSPAVDAGDNPNSDACDQRGSSFGRQSGSGVDIGAYELQVGTSSLHAFAPALADIIFRDAFEVTAPCS